MHRLTCPTTAKICNLIIVLLLLPFLSLDIAGCASMGASDPTKFHVIPVSSRDVAALSSDDVVRIMRRAGFSDDQILELGTQVRNAILLSGAVEIKRGKVVEAIFAVKDNNVFITAGLRGNFIYNAENGTWIRLEALTPRLPRQAAPH
jgi:hypothetical protein